MLKGTSVAVSLVDELIRTAIDQKAQPDLLSDLRVAGDRLIVWSMRAVDNKENREAMLLMCREVVETFAVAMTTRGYDVAIAEAAFNAQAE